MTFAGPSAVMGSEPAARPARRPLTIGVPKGRILTELTPLFGRLGIDLTVFAGDSRKLLVDVAERAGVPAHRLLLLRPTDVPTYVEAGVADLAACGSDTLEENGADVLEPLDLGVGRCRLSVAGAASLAAGGLGAFTRVRVATKYPSITRQFFRARGIEATIIHLYGSVELAALAGLSDLVVDLVSSGATLRENGLAELETIRTISTRLVVNRASLKTRHGEIARLLETLEAGLGGAT